MSVSIYDGDAERSVLGGILLDNSALGEVMDLLNPDDFGIDQYAETYRAMLSLAGQNKPIDYVTLADELRAQGTIERAGGIGSILGLDTVVPSTANIMRYARIVCDLAIRRRGVIALQEAVERLADQSVPASDTIGNIQQTLMQVEDKQSVDDLPTFGDALAAEMKALEELYERNADLTGITSGLASLDHFTCGFQRGELFVFAGRPSSGKTLGAIQFALCAIQSGAHTLAFSQEMKRSSLIRRILSRESRVSANVFRNGKFTPTDFAKMHPAASRLFQLRFWIDDRRGLTIPQVRSRMRRTAHKHGPLDLVVIDYLQVLRSLDQRKPREQQVAEFASGAKSLALEFNCAIIGLAQAGRDVEKRADKRPMLSDLRESASLEAEADIVTFIHRPEMFDRENPDLKNVAEFIVAKNRNGPTGICKARFNGVMSSFEDMGIHGDE